MIDTSYVISFLLKAWQCFQLITVNISGYHFSIADILVTELIIGIGFIIVNILWNLGVYNIGGD